MRGDALEHARHCAYRRRHQDKIGPINRYAKIVGDLIDYAERTGTIEVGLAASDTDDVLDVVARFQRERERAPDQPDADHDQLPDRDHATRFPSAVASASRKRSFSCGSPTVTRR